VRRRPRAPRKEIGAALFWWSVFPEPGPARPHRPHDVFPRIERLADLAQSGVETHGDIVIVGCSNRESQSRGARRRVPIVPKLELLLRRHKDATGRSGSHLVFGRSATKPFVPSTVRSRALKAWAAADPPLTPIGLHEARHTFAR
jgi:integrase